MKARVAIICILCAMITLSLGLYYSHWNSKPVRTKRMTEEYYRREIEQLQAASPRRAAAAAVAHGNLKFYIVQHEHSRPSLPGITNGHSLKWIYDREQYRVIFFAPDYITRPQYAYHRVAWRYAASYNLALEQLILTNSLSISSNP